MRILRNAIEIACHPDSIYLEERPRRCKRTSVDQAQQVPPRCFKSVSLQRKLGKWGISKLHHACVRCKKVDFFRFRGLSSKVNESFGLGDENFTV